MVATDAAAAASAVATPPAEVATRLVVREPGSGEDAVGQPLEVAGDGRADEMH